MTTPALQEHKPRELTDVLIADRERLRKWIERIRSFAEYAYGKSTSEQIENMCARALNGEDVP